MENATPKALNTAENTNVFIGKSIKFLIGVFALVFSKENLTGAIDAAKAELDKQAAEFHNTTQEDKSVFDKSIEVTVDGLDIVSDALHLAGEHKAALVIEKSEGFLGNIQANGGHPILAALQFIFKRKEQEAQN